jgi:hypothetical protein
LRKVIGPSGRITSNSTPARNGEALFADECKPMTTVILLQDPEKPKISVPGQAAANL